jgi:ATP-dependent helicase HrpA
MSEPLPNKESIQQAMLRDRHALRGQWKTIQQWQRQAKPIDQLVEKFNAALARSLNIADQRSNRRPNVRFDQDLPILAHREEIAATIRDHQVVVISGETGSGKSTQLPKIALDAGFGIHGLIGHTQPRRIAARSIANRVADELGVSLGTDVGFKIRFTDKTSPLTFIKLMTDGILLAETQNDRFLEQYELLVIDEAHERSLNIDFLLGYLNRILPNRPELRVIVTSATIDAERFSRHFADGDRSAPVLRVSGRTYPVEVRYRPLEVADEDVQDSEQINGILAAVHELAAIDRGHILVFLPTERDIRETARRLRAEKFAGDGSRKTEILPLYARLSTAEQNKVFQPASHRRIVLATNVAESSLTVPGIRYVVDTGTARISRYSPRSKVQRLPIEAVSRASADQRQGRCGRVADGICIRLFGQSDFENRSQFTTPEVQRTNLASVILQAKALKLGPVDEFPFLDPPRPETIRDGYKTLFEIGAVDERRELTEIGRVLSRLPLDPRIGRVVLAGDEENCLEEILIIAAALENQDPRERPYEKRQAADEAHTKFVDERSDFLSFLKLWDFYHQLKERLSRSQLRKACTQNFLSLNRMREWTEIHRQLLQLAATQGLKPRSRQDDTTSVHRALLTGFLSGVAYRSGDVEYTGAGGIKFFLWPGSGVFEKKPKWAVVSEVLETTRRYGRIVAEISPNWVLPLAEHLVKRAYSDPHFHQKSGSVMAYERVTLYGLPIVAHQRVPYGHIDPTVAREIFIREGLAKQDLSITDKFYVHNERLLGQLAKQAAKTRRAEYLTDTYTIAAFYEARIPRDVVGLDSLRKWLRISQRHGARPLHMEIEDLAQLDQSPVTVEQFPDELKVASMNLPLSYAFSPGESEDGVSITVPEDALGHLDPGQLGWLVPGLLEEKIVALIRSLPKSIRRALIPAPDTAHKVASEIEFGQGDFLSSVAHRLAEVADEPIAVSDFQLEKISPHLEVNVRVTDQDGKVKAEGRSVIELRQRLGVEASQEIDVAGDDTWKRDGITSWDFGQLDETVTLSRGGVDLPAHPTLIDAGEDVQLRLLTSRWASRHYTRGGLRRLYVLNQRKQLHSQVSWLPDMDQLTIYVSQIMSADDLRRQLTDLIADIAFLRDEKKIPRNHEEFSTRLANSAERIGVATQNVAGLLPKLLRGVQDVRLAVEQNNASRFQYSVEDVQMQLTELTGGSFLVETPWRWLREFPRYFQAICYRLERLTSGPLERDRTLTEEIRELRRRYLDRKLEDEQAGRFDPELEMYRWMIEEYRVSAFAQPIGTIFSVSPQRLDKQWDKVGRSM